MVALAFLIQYPYVSISQVTQEFNAKERRRLHGTVEFKKVLADASFIISEKLALVEGEVVFLGKSVDFGWGTILNMRRALEDASSRCVLTASRSVRQKSVQRVVGKRIWACRPSHWSNFFLAGPIAHVQWGAKWLPHAPTSRLRSLSGELWFAGRGWRPRMCSHHL